MNDMDSVMSAAKPLKAGRGRSRRKKGTDSTGRQTPDRARQKAKQKEKEELLAKILKGDRLVVRLIRLEEEQLMRSRLEKQKEQTKEEEDDDLPTPLASPSPSPTPTPILNPIPNLLPEVPEFSPVPSPSNEVSESIAEALIEEEGPEEMVVEQERNDDPVVDSNDCMTDDTISIPSSPPQCSKNSLRNIRICKKSSPVVESEDSAEKISSKPAFFNYHAQFESFIRNRDREPPAIEVFETPPRPPLEIHDNSIPPPSYAGAHEEFVRKISSSDMTERLVEPLILRRKNLSCCYCLKKFHHSKELKKHLKLFHPRRILNKKSSSSSSSSIISNNSNRVVIKITKNKTDENNYQCLVKDEPPAATPPSPLKIKIKDGGIVSSNEPIVDFQNQQQQRKKRGRRRLKREPEATPEVREMPLGDVLTKTPHDIVLPPFESKATDDDNVTNGQESGYLSNQVSLDDSEDEEPMKPKMRRKRKLSSSSESAIFSEVEQQPETKKLKLKDLSVVLNRIQESSKKKIKIKSIENLSLGKLQRVMNALTPCTTSQQQPSFVPLTILITDVSYLPHNPPAAPPPMPPAPLEDYVCQVCTQMRDIVDMTDTMDSENIKCTLCPKVFQSLDYLEFHISREHLRCENERECQQSRKHSMSITSQESDLESETYVKLSLKCRCCYELFDNVANLNAHVRLKHSNLLQTGGGGDPSADEIFTCLLCKSTFVMREESFDHLLEEHHRISCKFSCQTCLISYRTPEAQEQHKCVERNLCPTGEMLRVSTGKRNLELTPDTGKREDNLRSKCTMCSNRYRHKENFLEHLKRQHGLNKARAEKLVDKLLPKPTREENENWTDSRDRNNALNQTSCSKCGRSFKPPQHLLKHNNKLQLCLDCSSGGGGGAFSCGRCLKEFNNVQDLREHRLDQHKKGDKPFPCNICQKSFSSITRLKMHKSNQHQDSIEKVIVTNTPPTPPDDQPKIKIDKRTKKWKEIVQAREMEKRARRAMIDQQDTETLECVVCELKCESTVTLKNHLKNDHKCNASVCQLCERLINDEVCVIRHMLDWHIVPSGTQNDQQRVVRPQESDVDELLIALGKERLYSLLVYHDFEGRRNSETMKCPGCSQTFANSHSCKHHYVHAHEKLCLLCDEVFRSGEMLSKHNTEVHKAVATYFWCIQIINNSVVKSLGLDEDSNSLALYEELLKRLNYLEGNCLGPEFEVFTEDQLPDPGLEVTIGREEVEDDLLGMLNDISPNYEGINKDLEEVFIQESSILYQSGFYWHKFDNGSEEQVLVITQEDELSYRDDLSQLAKKIGSTNEQLGLDEIEEMLGAYFRNKDIVNSDQVA